MAEMGSMFGMGRRPSPESTAPEMDLFDPEIEAMRRAFMQRQMKEAQGISDAVPRRPPAFQWAPPASQLLPEWPITAPWPGSPRNTRVV